MSDLAVEESPQSLHQISSEDANVEGIETYAISDKQETLDFNPGDFDGEEAEEELEEEVLEEEQELEESDPMTSENIHALMTETQDEDEKLDSNLALEPEANPDPQSEVTVMVDPDLPLWRQPIRSKKVDNPLLDKALPENDKPAFKKALGYEASGGLGRGGRGAGKFAFQGAGRGAPLPDWNFRQGHVAPPVVWNDPQHHNMFGMGTYPGGPPMMVAPPAMHPPAYSWSFPAPPPTLPHLQTFHAAPEVYQSGIVDLGTGYVKPVDHQASKPRSFVPTNAPSYPSHPLSHAQSQAPSYASGNNPNPPINGSSRNDFTKSANADRRVPLDSLAQRPNRKDEYPPETKKSDYPSRSTQKSWQPEHKNRDESYSRNLSDPLQGAQAQQKGPPGYGRDGTNRSGVDHAGGKRDRDQYSAPHYGRERDYRNADYDRARVAPQERYKNVRDTRNNSSRIVGKGRGSQRDEYGRGGGNRPGPDMGWKRPNVQNDRNRSHYEDRNLKAPGAHDKRPRR